MSRFDINAPRIWYDPKTREYVVFGRQPMFLKNGKAPELGRFETKAEARPLLKEVLAQDKTKNKWKDKTQ